MDWLVELSPSNSGRPARSLVMDHVRRRAAVTDDLPLADTLIGGALDSPGASALWVRLSWQGPHPVLTVRSRPEPLAADDRRLPLADGVWAPDLPTDALSARFAGSPEVTVTLPVPRAPTASIDLGPEEPGPERPADYTGSVAAILAGQVSAGATLSEAAAVAGASAAEAAAKRWADEHGGRSPETATELADAFMRFTNAAGADFRLVEADESGRRAVVSNGRCPFGPVADREVLCRSTSALLGSLAARSAGRATVSLDEAIAGGDHRCLAVLDLDAERSRWNHEYSWPPAGPAASPGQTMTRGFRISISLQLPRDLLSVPLIRHMVHNALAEVGAVDEDVDAVEIAVSEAAGNVIRHSGKGDAYTVEVTIGPLLAELRVVDIGRGFDSDSLHQSGPSPTAESGRGMALMNALVDQARFESAPERGTIVHLVKQLHFDDDAPARQLMLSQLQAERDEAG